MKDLKFSFIVPVFNRPAELEKLLESLSLVQYKNGFEVVVIEDGSTVASDVVCSRFRESVNINYLSKQNTGPGDSRNYGMQRAGGNYFIILDSDCIVPKDYLQKVHAHLEREFVECYGGPDAAHESFTNLQKAINYSMTSTLTTGGIRGGNETTGKFQPRSFNMGLSRKAFEASGGFRTIHPGEDPDLTMRLWNLGFETALFADAFVYHERRISWKLFYKQVNKFGKVRVILNKWHPGSRKITYWFPTLFLIYVCVAVVFAILGVPLLLLPLALYGSLILVGSSLDNGFVVGVMSIIAVLIQFAGYGLGFLNSYIQIGILKNEERDAFPYLFFE
ncbi:glycosyltransferase [Nonlabens agnitus]|uniref:Glycosyl transferase family 2 n=1 Tax=Nonlabens agnitus TaxID=870484 RepID=A0A2S9WRJ7_9FLAO|nr:glycosyltransferase [Nonlabens agnitus]PRP66118.1 glycosyl transferase family 2 [Nonlabens agnitus]